MAYAQSRMDPSETTTEPGSAEHEGVDQAPASISPLAWRLWLGAELAVVFIVLPTAFRLGLIQIPLIAAIGLLGVTAAIVLLVDHEFDRASIWRLSPIKREAPRIALIFLTTCLIGTAAVLVLIPDRFLAFPRSSPGWWAMVMMLYPIFSALPQEIVFRGFFFHRYRPLFRAPWAMIIAGAIVFGYVHIVMGNALAIGLSAIGGVLFGWTYLRTKSIPAATIEHALYGCFIFTVGLGRFFFHAPG